MPAPIRWDPPDIPFRAADVGVSRKVLWRCAAKGTIVQVIQGVYLNAEAWPDDARGRHLMCALAHQTRRAGLVASHATAALALDLPLPNTARATDEAPIFTVPATDRNRSSRAPRVHSRDLTSRECTHLTEGAFSGLAITTAPRTAVDLAAEHDVPEALIALDAAARLAYSEFAFGKPRGHLDPRVLDGCREPLFESAANHPKRGHVRNCITAADPRRESPGESISAGVFILAGLPPPTPQFRVDADGVFYIDFGWPEYGVVGECDGMIKYQDHTVLVREKLRQEALERAGWLVVRWTYQEIVLRPEVVIARVERALRRGGWLG